MYEVGHVVVGGRWQSREVLEGDGGILYRKDTADKKTIAEIQRSYGWLDVSDKVVLDVGAHIGSFSKWAIDHGARMVIAVEPEPCNYDMLARNTPRNVVRIAKAVMGDFRPQHASLWYTNRGHSHGMVSTTEFRGRHCQPGIPTVSFSELVSLYSPEVVKVDCEGGEYDFLDGQKIGNSVKQIAAELHFTKKAWRDIHGPRLLASFKGWHANKVPTIGEHNWTTIAGWVRDP